MIDSVDGVWTRVHRGAWRDWLLALCLAGSGMVQAADGDSVVVRTSLGELRGEQVNGVSRFLGIPYAAPPTGERRFRPPEPPAPWDGRRDAVAYGPACMQLPYPRRSIYYRPPGPQSEDCLTLNVWTETPTPLEPRPVMVWLHGGGLTRGTGAVPTYDGAALARADVVVVTINYRLGVFGYLAHPDLARENRRRAGNYGVLDQIRALTWVRDHIDAFGGDPQRVTVFGESAGSTSVNVLMASPLARGLFHGAIGQSGGRMADMPSLKGRRDGALAVGREFARHAGARSGKALRAMPAAELLQAFETWNGADIVEPVVDGWVLERTVREVFERGEQAPVPVMVGYNRDEALTLVGHLAPTDPATWRARVESSMGPWAARFDTLYPPEQPARAFLDSFTDRRFGWPMHTWARLTEQVKRPAWLYHFVRAPAATAASGLGAYHAAEIAYVFGNLPPTADETDRRLSRAMMRYWTNFARSGDPNDLPNDATVPRWPSFTGGRQQYLLLGDNIASGRDLNAARQQFWDDVWADDDDGVTP